MGDRTRELRTGNQTRRIYPRVAAAMIALRDHKHMHHAEKATGMSSQSIAFCIRNAEKKLGVRLFSRSRGRGDHGWTALRTEATSIAWKDIENVNNFQRQEE